MSTRHFPVYTTLLLSVLPPIVSDLNSIQSEVEVVLKSHKELGTESKADHVKTLTQYLGFLGIEKSKWPVLQKATLLRLGNSSTQFLFCSNFEDWACLEKDPLLKPSTLWRQGTDEKLGAPLFSDEPFKIEVYFTNHFDPKDAAMMAMPKTVVSALSDKIKSDGDQRILGALYGMDDLQGSMKPVLDAAIQEFQSGSDLKVVLDTAQESDANAFLRLYDVELSDGSGALKRPKEILFSYVDPQNPADRENWIFGRPQWMDKLIELGPKFPIQTTSDFLASEIKDANWFAKATKLGPDILAQAKSVTRMAYQYDETPEIVRLLNQGIKTDDEARARLEFPGAGIMHNKFFVIEGKNGSRVWSGTANISKTCMGEELNSNMSIYIKNNAIAQTFKDEFSEMFEFSKDKSFKDPKGILKNIQGGDELPIGKFHQSKRPNTHRYFVFKDGTEVRVHFSPTDDAEHRVIIPLLLSARPKDQIRVAMFGGAGIELVRAFQFAAARGANIQMVLDGTTGAQAGAWIKNEVAKVQDKNPYADLVDRGGAPLGKIDIRMEDWPGLNHHKTATLSRFKKVGIWKDEVITVGSQNWTLSGNDENDENMVTIRNKKGKNQAATAFVNYFDKILWPKARLDVNGVLMSGQ